MKRSLQEKQEERKKMNLSDLIKIQEDLTVSKEKIFGSL